MSEMIINKVAASALITFDLEEYFPEGERVIYDLKDNLYEGIAIRENEFRAFLEDFDWAVYTGKNVAITCSEDAIIPTWAYMLLISKIEAHANHVIIGDLEDLENSLFQRVLDRLDVNEFKDKKVVLKGCSSKAVPVYAYAELTRKLLPVVSSLMFGEPCSTVPIFKRAKVTNKG